MQPHFDSGAQAVFELVDRVVWIVTAAAAGQRGGLIATFAQPASIDPAEPLVSIGLAANHFTTELVAAGMAFGLHLIGPEQAPLAWRFALASGRDVDKLAGLECQSKRTGAPILQDCLAWLDCAVVDQHSTGDRVYFWADVVAGERRRPGAPMREAQLLAAATAEQKAALRAGLIADQELQRPLRARWRANLRTAGRPS